MFDRKTMILAIGGIALAGIAVAAAGLMVRKQTNKLRNNIRTVSRGVYNFGTALQLLSGAADEQECEAC